jgi:hypothetical protein
MADNRNDLAVPSGEDSPVPADLADAFKFGPRGALFLSIISVALLFAGWLAFYFLFFLPRGPIG